MDRYRVVIRDGEIYGRKEDVDHFPDLGWKIPGNGWAVCLYIPLTMVILFKLSKVLVIASEPLLNT